jgi:PAS domain S-box-containing protein
MKHEHAAKHPELNGCTREQLIEELIKLRNHGKGLEEFCEKQKCPEQGSVPSDENDRHLSQQSFDAVIIHVNDKIVYVNHACARLLGARRPAELVGKCVLDIVHPNYRSIVQDQIDEASYTNAEPAIEEKFVTLDGQTIDTEVMAFKILYQSRPAIKVVFRDITGRIQLEEKLRLTQFTLDRAADMIFWVAPDGHFTYVNNTASRVLGYTREELLTMAVFDINTLHSKENWEEHRQELKRHESITFENTFIAKDGRRIPVELSVNYLAFGGREYNCASVRDITRRKQAEEEREIVVEFLRLMNETRNTKDLIHATTVFFQEKSGCEAVGIRLREGDDYPYYEARGFRPGFIRKENSLCNRDAQGTIIRDRDGFPVLDCICGNVITGRFDPTQPFFTERGSFWTNSTTELLSSTTEKDRLAKTRNVCNTEGYESFALIALRIGDERLGVLQLNDRRKGHFTPEQIAMWERLADHLAVALAKFQAEDALQDAKAQAELYLDLMGHDINNMHQVALGYLELAAELEENENMKELLERPRDVLLRSARLIDNVRKLQKLKNGTYLFRPIDLVRVLTDVVKEYEAVPGKVLMLDTHFINAGYVQANELLYDVFSNLVSNAVKYSGSHARVTIGLSAVLENGSHFYQVSVEDNGPGIPDSFKLKVFNRMLQGDAGAKGMGLGLYIVKTLVDSYQGRVWVENRVPGDHTKGAKFIVRLPALHKD